MKLLKSYRSTLAIIVLLFIIGLVCMALSNNTYGQAPATPIDGLTNLPSVSLSYETFGISVGTVMKGTSSFESALAFEYVVHTNFAFAVEMQNATGSTAIDSVGAYFKLRKAWDNYEIYGLMGGRRNFDVNTWEGIAGFGAAWTPASGTSGWSVFNNFSLFAEQRIIVDSLNKSSRPQTETVAGLKRSF